MSLSLTSAFVQTPVGRLQMVAQSDALIALLWENERLDRVRLNDSIQDDHHPVLVETRRQLDQYFSRERETFSIPIKPRGTPFQTVVWDALRQIPYGQTTTYGKIAEQIGRPRAVRAVGGANGKNPISIIIPCHRVIGASGKLTGFAGGLDNKQRLLRFERDAAPPRLLEFPAVKDLAQ